MNAAHHIAQAEGMLSTGQIPLAMLHMRRATEYLAEARPASALQLIFDAIAEAFRPVIATIRAASEAIGASIQADQADYALAGPTKGGTA